ncbi:hypothetical protein V501_05637 [Pseudogymnoascus sp. VKM F-4519 (FW-2642)]|nr:hypothetical protein V499_03381 [Pseudogymnoascus sp. VKM F-103]KFZ09290.1 hypothetical protein V501_05637 [Pseudogymnoascus sp. VKM F-4519 (FW-2642)]
MSVTQRSDEELDREWKPSGRRPQSTMARHFSITLDDLFKIDNSIADLDAAVDQKKRLVSTHTSELKALEEALRATEERLKATAALPDRAPSPRARKAISGDTFENPQDDNTLNAPNTAERPKTASRPGTARKPVPSPTQNTNLPPMPGARPPTPGASESESDESKEE